MSFNPLSQDSVTGKMSAAYDLSCFLESLEKFESHCYVYIHQLSDSTYYTGITAKPASRYIDHQARRSVSTRYKLPLKMVCLIKCLDRKSARLLEKRIKSNGAKASLIKFQTLVLINDSDLLYYHAFNIHLDRYKEYNIRWFDLRRKEDVKLSEEGWK